MIILIVLLFLAWGCVSFYVAEKNYIEEKGEE